MQDRRIPMGLCLATSLLCFSERLLVGRKTYWNSTGICAIASRELLTRRAKCFNTVLVSVLLVVMSTVIWAGPPWRSASAETDDASDSRGQSQWFVFGRSTSPESSSRERKSATKAMNPSEDLRARLRRRLEVCDRLKLLALETNDVRLEQAVCDLEDMIWQWYWRESQQRSGRGQRSAAPRHSPVGADPYANPGLRALPPAQPGNPDHALPSPKERGSARTDRVPNRLPSGILPYERLDRLEMHTIRGSAPEAAPPVLDTVWSSRQTRDPAEERQR